MAAQGAPALHSRFILLDSAPSPAPGQGVLRGQEPLWPWGVICQGVLEGWGARGRSQEQEGWSCPL